MGISLETPKIWAEFSLGAIMRVLVFLLVIAAVVAVNVTVLRLWWRAAIAKPRSVVVLLLLPLMLATILFGPLFAVGTAAAWAFTGRPPWLVFIFSMLWLLPTFIVSFRYAQEYQRTRSSVTRSRDATHHA